MQMLASEPLVTATEAAKALGIGRYTLYKLTRNGVVPVVRLGRSCRYSPAALREFIESGGRPDAATARETANA